MLTLHCGTYSILQGEAHVLVFDIYPFFPFISVGEVRMYCENGIQTKHGHCCNYIFKCYHTQIEYGSDLENTDYSQNAALARN